MIGDKVALLDAVAEYELAAYVASKQDEAPHPDPVEGLRRAGNFEAAHTRYLRGNEERAVDMVHAAGLEVAMKLISQIELPEYGDLSADTRDAAQQAVRATGRGRGEHSGDIASAA